MENINYKSVTEIETLFNSFRDKTLPKTDWTHEAHLTVALWHIYHYDLEDAICRMKSGIMNYNVHIGGENTANGGYHETITIFWMDTIKRYKDEHPEMELIELCNSFLNSTKAVKTYPFEFYDKEQLLSSYARARFLAPDLKNTKNERE